MIRQHIFRFLVVFAAIFSIECGDEQNSTQTVDDAAAYNHRGHIHEAEGDYDQAIADLTRAVKLAPDDMHYRNDLATAYVYRGQAHLIQGNNELGLADLRQYARLARDNAAPEVLDLIALIER